MSGKGSKPRPVDGETYRANYDAIFQVGRDLRARRTAYVDHIVHAIRQDPNDIINARKLRAAYNAGPYPDWICAPCGQAHGRGWPEGHVATFHAGTCDICGQSASVSEPRDYGHLRTWPLTPVS